MSLLDPVVATQDQSYLDSVLMIVEEAVLYLSAVPMKKQKPTVRSLKSSIQQDYTYLS